jgi:hypothetical protein
MNTYDRRWSTENMIGFTDFNRYLDHVVERTQARMLCYDCYCQLSEEWGGRDQYFRNLARFQAAALRHRIPFWNITLTLGHWMYRAPTPIELGWEFYTSLAYGAQGILYFLYRASGIGNYGMPVDDLGQQGPLCPQLRRMHHQFQSQWEERFRRCAVQRTTHWPTGPAGTLSFDGTGLVRAIRESPNASIRASPRPEVLVGEFADDRGRPHVLLANNSPDPTKHVAVNVTFAGTAVFEIQGPDREHRLSVNESGPGTVTLWSIYIMPGQAVFYRLEP